MRTLALACFASLSLCLAGPVRANDTAMGGTSTDLVPMQNADVRMLSEDILIREDGDAWQVRADYVFLNQTSEDVALSVGFPEHRCGALPGEEDAIDCVSPRPLDFESMRTTIDGVEVEHEQGKLDRRHPWAPRLGTVWLYPAQFPAGREVHITHRYRVLQGVDSSGAKLGFYVTRTGATWAGSIGHARFRVRVPANAFELYLPSKERGLALTTRLVEVDGRPVGEILLEADDWNPDGDIDFGYRSYLAPWVEVPDLTGAPARAGLPGTARCPLFNELWQSGLDLAAAGAKQPDAARVASYLQKDIGDPRICRNMLFAVRGRRFADDRLNRYFYGPEGYVVGSFPYAPFRPSPVFDEAQLTAGDWAAVRLVDAIAQAQGSPLPEEPSAHGAVGSEAPAEPAESPAAKPTTTATANDTPAAQAPSGSSFRLIPMLQAGIAGLLFVSIARALAWWRRRRRPRAH